MRLDYFTIRACAATFENEKIRTWVLDHAVPGRVLNLCCGPTKLDFESAIPAGQSVEVTRVDLNPDIDADLYVDARNIADHFEKDFDLIIYDPPFSADQADRTYEGYHAGYSDSLKEQLHDVLKPGGRVIQLGFTSAGMPVDLGYTRQSLAVFNNLGRMKDWVGIVDDHRPGSPGSPEASDAPAGFQTVPLNATGQTRTDVGNTTAIRMRVQTIETAPESPLESQAVLASLLEHIEGTTLDTHGALRDRATAIRSANPDMAIIANDGDDRGTSLASFTTAGDRLASRTPADALQSTYDRVFETVVFSPDESVFHRNTRDGGVDSAIKQSIDRIVRPGGRVIQVAPGRSSCMRSDLGYRRETVDMLATPGSNDPIYITIDRKAHDLDESTGVPDAHFPYFQPCLHCGSSITTDPAVGQHGCPTCGAAADTACEPVDSEALMADLYHPERVQRVLERHPLTDGCSRSPDGVHAVARPDAIHVLPHLDLASALDAVDRRLSASGPSRRGIA